MAVRILFLIIGATIAINLVLTAVSLITGVNLYQKYGKQILIFFSIYQQIIKFFFDRFKTRCDANPQKAAPIDIPF